MRGLLRVVPIMALAAAMAGSSVSAAETKAVQTMAGILLKLNHFPSDAEKKTLKEIVDDKTATAHERTVAQALINVQHAVSPADKPKLEAVIKEQSAPDSIKTLARVIINLNHTPTDADKDRLKKLTS
jgi:hypothetical protein